MRLDLDIIRNQVEKAFKNLPEHWDHYTTIELLETFNKELHGWVFELTGDSGYWKYGLVDIKQAWLDNRGAIHCEVGPDFFEKNIDNQSDLIRVMRSIMAHENAHFEQMLEDPGMTIDEDHYLEDPREIIAHARETGQELLDLDVFEFNENTYANSNTAFVYWTDYGQYAEEDEHCNEIWSKFEKEVKRYLKQYNQKLYEQILNQEHLQEMGYTPIEQGARQLRKFVKNLIGETETSQNARNNNKSDPDTIAKLAVEKLISMGSGNHKEFDDPATSFIPVSKQGETIEMQKTLWIKQVIHLLSDLAIEIIVRLEYWLNRLIP